MCFPQSFPQYAARQPAHNLHKICSLPVLLASQERVAVAASGTLLPARLHKEFLEAVDLSFCCTTKVSGISMNCGLCMQTQTKKTANPAIIFLISYCVYDDLTPLFNYRLI